MASLWAADDLVTADKLNKTYNAGLDSAKGTPSVVGEAYQATDTGFLYVSMDGSTWDKQVIAKTVVVKVLPDVVALAAGDGKSHFTVPEELDGMNLITVGAHVYTGSSSGNPTFQIHNLTGSVDMLSTPITIDATEKDSSTATTPAIINTANDDVATGDELRFDCDVAGTGAKGMEIRLGFRTP